MIRRRNFRDSDEVKITFVLPGDHPYPKSSVVGDFNDWDKEANQFRKRSNGKYSTAVTLKKGQRYVYRYISEDGIWFNEGDADAYETNAFGSEDGILLT